MQAARHRAFSTSQGGDASGFSHEFQTDPGLSRTSTYTVRSQIVDIKVRRSRSFWEVAAAIAGACTNCFAPRRPKIMEGHDKPSSDALDMSTSSMSRISSVTSAVVAAVERVMELAAECTAPDRAARPAMRRCAEVLWSVRCDFQRDQQNIAAAGVGTGTRRHDGSTAMNGSSVTSLE